MTNEQAIDRLRKISEKTPIRTNGDDLVAITMAIKALSQEPTEKPMCDRNICISNEYNGIGCDECIVNKVEQEPCDRRKNHEEKPHSLLDAYFQMRKEERQTEQQTCEDKDIYEPCDDTVSRKFVELVVEYPPDDLCAYSEYKGKPYYSIKYHENGEEFIGYGTYKPEVLSQYLKEYFIPPVTQSAKDYLDMADRKAKKIKDALTVTQKSGKWLITPMSRMAYCSECDFLFKDIPASIVKHFKYCPNCGSAMKGE